MFFSLKKITLILIILTLFITVIAAEENQLAHGDKIPNVLLLQSYHQGYRWSDELGQGVVEILQDDVEVHIEYMDSKKYYSPEYLAKIKDYLIFKSETIDFDLIIAADNNAFEFLKKYKKEIYGDIPVVFTGINFLNIDSLAGINNITGISEENNFQGTLQLMRDLFPERRKLICILDNTVTGQANKAPLNKALLEFEQEFNSVEIWSDISMKDLVRDLELLGDDFIVYTIIFQKDNQGEYFEYNHSNTIIGNAANVPVFGAWDFQFPYGIVGGYLLRGVEQGREAGLMAKRILDGENVNSIPIVWKTPHSYMFDFEQLLTYSIRMDMLPRDSIVINLPNSIFQQYHTETTIILIAFILLLILIFFLVVNIQKRKRSESELQNLNATLNESVERRTSDLKISNGSLNDTLEKLKNTQKQLIQKERLAALGSLVSGIAHEVNTPLGIGITTSSYIIDLISKLQIQLNNDELTREALDEFIERLNQGSSLLSKNLNKTASLIDSFKNLSFDETGGDCLNFNLLDYIEEIIRTHAMQFNHQNVKISLKGDSINIHSYPGSFYHIINNLLMNSLSHGFSEISGKKQITITLNELEGKSGLIEYRDNGRGIPAELKDHMFEPFTTSSRSEGKTGLGLFIIFKTVNEKLGGAVEYFPAEEDSDQEGVCFRIYFPINNAIDKF